MFAGSTAEMTFPDFSNFFERVRGLWEGPAPLLKSPIALEFGPAPPRSVQVAIWGLIFQVRRTAAHDWATGMCDFLLGPSEQRLARHLMANQEVDMEFLQRTVSVVCPSSPPEPCSRAKPAKSKSKGLPGLPRIGSGMIQPSTEEFVDIKEQQLRRQQQYQEQQRKERFEDCKDDWADFSAAL